MKKMFLLLLMNLIVSSMSAQSTVHVFAHSLSNVEVKLMKNGEYVFDMRGELRKTLKPTSSVKYPLYTYSPAYRKCTFKEDGKVLLSIDVEHTNCTTGDVTHYADEIQLNLSPGSTHYVYLTNKGLFNLQLKEITEKEANKLLKDKKMVVLDEYVEP